MIRPIRLQLSRRAGFNLQAESRKINGLPAVNCARPGVWGNPFIVGEPRVPTASVAVDLYGNMLGWPLRNFYHLALETLPGHNLACWCGLFDPCHVDVLLDIFGRIRCDRIIPAESGQFEPAHGQGAAHA